MTICKPPHRAQETITRANPSVNMLMVGRRPIIGIIKLNLLATEAVAARAALTRILAIIFQVRAIYIPRKVLEI